ncbi:GNAT family N-acetyltransferase [Falsiphaeobacter marinintestinus]|uniref:GNAT family N-acetyltransferase n=1 Tax=Falsiphaeobacter marinintestinus TaxID=1492905 RepID=UPI0011B607DB|nr:GNAT family N-acetyltransferase [Phaeobacter marinintestinus]
MSTHPSIAEIVDGTWPAAEYRQVGPWTLRRGDGGGSRVSAATVNGAFDDSDIDAAEAAMRDMGQRPLFMIRPEDAALDAALAARGYEAFDAVNIYECGLDQLTDLPIPRVTVLVVWEPLAIMCEAWASGGIGPERLAVMQRAKGPKTGLLGRYNDKPGGVGFVAIQGDAAMVHALEILPHQRGMGLGKWMMRGAAIWARDHGATRMTVLCTQANDAANGLYSSLGMRVVGQYHYRRTPNEEIPT